MFEAALAQFAPTFNEDLARVLLIIGKQMENPAMAVNILKKVEGYDEKVAMEVVGSLGNSGLIVKGYISGKVEDKDLDLLDEIVLNDKCKTCFGNAHLFHHLLKFVTKEQV